MEWKKNIKQSGINTGWGIVACLLVLIAAMISCGLPGAPSASAQQTLDALAVQQTLIAQQASLDEQAAADAAQATQIALDLQATQLALLESQPVQEPTEPFEIVTQPPVEEQQPEVTEPPPSIDLDTKIKAAKILLFEDMSGYKAGYDVVSKFRNTYPERYVKTALDMGGYSYVDVGSAQGWLKDHLLSTTDWDLIIVANEARARIQGEYFEYLLDHINRKTGVILAVWYLDRVSEGKITSIISKCGVKVQKDWPSVGPLWPLIPDHPLLNEPNRGIRMSSYEAYWNGDSGDLLRLSGSGDAQLILGTTATEKSAYGTLASCMEGRLLIQTFCNHEFDKADTIPLWENYIYNVLRNKFMTTP